ncbi:MAG: multiple sugar transport system permease protein, partial [Candidatus Hydrogenedentes bacterium]|nr:multiple sugar transport system permease protein [Candidatus Hydrogenedentota bacterium]
MNAKHRERYRWHENVQGYLFAAPWLFGFFFFLVGPMIFSVMLCLYRWNGITAFSGNATFVGLDNFHKVFTEDRFFWISLYNTFYYAMISVPLGICTSLFLAVLLNAKIRGISIFRTIFYLPNVLAGVATIMMWSWIFNPDFGGFNFILTRTGLADLGEWVIAHVPGLAAFAERNGLSWPPMWFADEFWAKPALIIMSLWGAGGSMLIYLAGLQNVPAHLYEVAEIDGAGRIRQFFSITLPMLTPTIFFNLIMSIIGSFQVFAQSYLMTNGGPNNATLFYVLYLFRKAFQHFEMGYASALAWVLFAIILF